MYPFEKIFSGTDRKGLERICIVQTLKKKFTFWFGTTKEKKSDLW